MPGDNSDTDSNSSSNGEFSLQNYFSKLTPYSFEPLASSSCDNSEGDVDSSHDDES